MELKELVVRVSNFASLSHPDRILLFGWYVHTQRGKERFTQADVRGCYKALPMQEPNLSEQFKRLVDRRPRVLLEDGRGYHLEHSVMQKFNSAYGQHETTIALSKLMQDLPGKISDQAEQLFLSEAITCYHNRAFRAAIVMMWNLAYDHLLNWILKDAGRLSAFQSHIAGRVGARKAAGINVAKREDFEDLKESETLDIAGTAGLFPSANIKKILEMQLTKRNMAAHPSLVVIAAPEAEESIHTLINNVVLVLS